MLTLLRELLRDQLSHLPRLADLHARSDSSMPDQVLAWLDESEKALAKMRRPEAAALAAVRAKLLAGRDGYRDPQVAGELTPRKALRAAAALALSQAEQTLRDALQNIEGQLQPLRGQVVQLVSGAYLLGLLRTQQAESHEEWLRSSWQSIGAHEKTRGMHAYLSAALSLVDRLYLLDEVMTNLAAQPTPPAAGNLPS